MSDIELSAALLRELMHYDPDTGEFVRVALTQGAKVGRKLGSIGKDGYSLIYVKGRNYPAHRLAWLYVHGEWPPADVDHINGMRNDNRLVNLRAASRTTNNENQRRAHKGSKSGLLGVCYSKWYDRWAARIQVHGKPRHLGYFDIPEEAHSAYLAAKRQLHEGCTI